jgi:iron(III) transport system ATP-binding protein
VSTVLSLQSITKTIGSNTVLKDINLDVQDQEFLAILGSSGSGKTTLLRLISGFDSPDSGQIELGAKMVFSKGLNVSAEERRVGFVPQDAALFPHLSVAKNIEFGLSKHSAAERKQRVTELLQLVDLAGFEDRMPHQLSGGQRHRVALARALALS